MNPPRSKLRGINLFLSFQRKLESRPDKSGSQLKAGMTREERSRARGNLTLRMIKTLSYKSMIDFVQLAQSNIIDILNLTDASTEIQQQAVREAVEIILDNVASRIKAELLSEALPHYNHAFRDESSDEERREFLNAHVPNFEEIVKEETLRYKYLCATR